MGELIKVGMADLNVCISPNALTTLGLGSCVGIVLYDPVRKIAGLVHIMLPDSTKIINNENKAKFADTGIDALILRMTALGANRRDLLAKIAWSSDVCFRKQY
jgi:chemotaxis protein CheD